MASLSEEDLSCSICQEIFKDPVVTSCSHSFCKVCLQNWWELRKERECPICKKTSAKKSRPAVSLVLKNLCEAFLRERDHVASAESEDLHAEKLFCLDHQLPVCVISKDKNQSNNFIPIDEAAKYHREELQTYLKPLQERLKLLEQAKENCDQTAVYIKVQSRHTESRIKRQFEKLHKLLEEEEEARMSALRKEEEQKSQRMKEKIQALSREVDALTDTIRATEEELRAEDVSLLQNYKAAVKRVQQRPLMENPETVPGAGMERALIDEAKHLGNLAFSIWNKMRKTISFTPVVLDPNSAHPELILCEDLTSIRLGPRQKLPENPERFDSYCMVLGSEGFDSGFHSWDVEVGDNTSWVLGVAAESIQSRGGSGLLTGLWGMRLFAGKYSACCLPGPYIHVPVGKLERVRVSLDLDHGRLSFTNPDTNTHLHTFIHTSTEKMFPVICTGDPLPLRIVPVLHQDHVKGDRGDFVHMYQPPPLPTPIPLIPIRVEQVLLPVAFRPQAPFSLDWTSH